MSNGPVISPNEQNRSARRSTRVDETITLTIMGIDSWRGPYREQVSTITVSAHGCKYTSKYQVMNDSLVILELPNPNPKDPPLSARARVKWVRRPEATGDLFQTAIELEEPGNIWGLPQPPQDWLQFVVPKRANGTGKPHLVVSRLESDRASTSTEQGSSTVNDAAAQVTRTALKAGGASGPVAQLMAEFQQHMQRMLSQAAQTAIRERAAEAMADLRTELRREALQLVADRMAAQPASATALLPASATEGAQEATADLQAQWRAKLSEDLKNATERLEAHTQKIDQQTAALAASSIDRLQRLMESKRIEEIDRFIARLKEHLSPLIENAQRVSMELHKTQQDVEGVAQEVAKSAEKAAVEAAKRVEEVTKLADEKLLEQVDARLFWASNEMDREGRAVIEATFSKLHESLPAIAAEHASSSQAGAESAIEPIVSRATAALAEKATEFQRRFAEELKRSTQNQLDAGVAAAAAALEAKNAELQQKFEEQTLGTAGTIEPLLSGAASALREKAVELQRHFGEQMQESTRSHLEHVRGAFGEVEKQLQSRLESAVEPVLSRTIARLEEKAAESQLQFEERIEESNRARAEAASNALDELKQQLQTQAGTLAEPVVSRIVSALEEKAAELQGKFSEQMQELTRSHAEQTSRLFAEAKAQLESQVGVAAESVLSRSVAALEQKSGELQRQFAEQMKESSRSNLEHVGSAFADLAKGLARFSKE